MRYVCFANGPVGANVLRWLKTQSDELVALVVHPEDRQKCAADIREVSDLPPERILTADVLDRPESLTLLESLRPEIGVSVFFGYILKPSCINAFPEGVINLHPSYLPYNRGAFPNVWSIVDQTPAGVTIHYIDEGVDTGDIVAQERVEVLPQDTGQTLYHRLELACRDLFAKTWPAISEGRTKRLSQSKQDGTFHRTADVRGIDEIDLDREYTARYLLNVLRARTFPPHLGAYYKEGGERYYLKLDIQKADPSETES